MAAEGVEAKRVIFAPKMSKSAHIFRHAAADLFLDTVVYGAHSTATDALRGVSYASIYLIIVGSGGNTIYIHIIIFCLYLEGYPAVFLSFVDISLSYPVFLLTGWYYRGCQC